MENERSLFSALWRNDVVKSRNRRSLSFGARIDNSLIHHRHRILCEFNVDGNGRRTTIFSIHHVASRRA